jgi:hypothetical protein
MLISWLENKDLLIWTTFLVRIYIEHKKLLDYSYNLRWHLQANFVVVQTFLNSMAFGATLPNFVNILKLQVPWKQSITFYDNNKYTNWINIYKNVTMQKCLQLWNILHIEFSFCCELQRINQSSPVFNSFVHLQQITISISTTTKLELVLVYKKN